MASVFGHILKICMLCSIVVIVVWAAPLNDQCDSKTWTSFKNDFSKEYKDAADEQRHMKTFCDNLRMINAHNDRYERGEVTSTMGINQFADLTDEEFVKTHHGIFI